MRSDLHSLFCLCNGWCWLFTLGVRSHRIHVASVSKVTIRCQVLWSHVCSKQAWHNSLFDHAFILIEDQLTLQVEWAQRHIRHSLWQIRRQVDYCIDFVPEIFKLLVHVIQGGCRNGDTLVHFWNYKVFCGFSYFLRSYSKHLPLMERGACEFLDDGFCKFLVLSFAIGNEHQSLLPVAALTEEHLLHV